MTTYPMDLETPAGKPLSTTKGSPDARIGASGNVGSIPESLVAYNHSILFWFKFTIPDDH